MGSEVFLAEVNVLKEKLMLPHLNKKFYTMVRNTDFIQKYEDKIVTLQLFIPLSLQNPKLLVCNDTEVV
jgi:hypothetical protein